MTVPLFSGPEGDSSGKKMVSIFRLLFTTAHLVLAASTGLSQSLALLVPVKVEVRPNQQVDIKINVSGIQKYYLRMEGNPTGAKLIGDKFQWTPKKGDEDAYLVRLFLLDSAKRTVSETQMVLSLDRSQLKPYLSFEHPLPDTLQLVENKRFEFTATLKSRQGTDGRLLNAYFLFNDDFNLRSFDSCQIKRLGEQITFWWVPTNAEALSRYAKLRISIVDGENSIGSQVLNFKIQNINQPPGFKANIPDTTFISANEYFSIDVSAKDPDNDPLRYDYYPKSPLLMLTGSTLYYRPPADQRATPEFPKEIIVSVSDGTNVVKRTMVLKTNRRFTQPIIGDFTRKVFWEGDSLLTYLNVSDDSDGKQIEIQFNDLVLPQGIGKLTNHLVFEKKGSFIKVYSPGVLPYYLVDRDYTYSLAVTLSSKEEKWRPSVRVLELTVNNRPDPTSLGRQRDSLLADVNKYILNEMYYRSSLEKIYSRISRPWWKKVAAITGTLSGVLVLVQSQNPDKTVSAASAGISLVSILVANIPSLSEKALSDLSDKISSSKARIERIQDKELEFRTEWSFDLDRSDFEKTKAEVEEIISRGRGKRAEDICALLSSKTMKRRIELLMRQNSAKPDKSAELQALFRCPGVPKSQ